MAILGIREVIPRTYEHRLGGSPTASRVFVATTDVPTASSDIIGAIGIEHGSKHPDHSLLECDGFSLNEQDRHHVEITYTYSLPAANKPDDPKQPPWLQPDTWTFSVGTVNDSTWQYYPTSENNVLLRPLQNTAGDYFDPVEMLRPETKITISGARLELYTARLRFLCGVINSQPWLGFPRRTVLCTGMSASPAVLEWEDQIKYYWQIQTEFLVRRMTWDVELPNVGFNVKNALGKLERAYTYIHVDGSEKERVPTPNPIALDAFGWYKCPPD